MRADRLLAVLLLLQQREQVTAAEVAQELEISERTARRDLDALAMAGVPVYSTRGRGGGWRLVGGARTDLTGLNEGEARALFLTAGAASTASPEVNAALRKLVQALPETFRGDAEAAASSLVVDPDQWGSTRPEHPEPPHLRALQDAVISSVQVQMSYVDRDGAESERLVAPFGVVSKGTRWYLIAGTAKGQRTFRIDRVSAVAPTGDAVVRPADFDLAESWRQIADEVDRRRAPFEVQATCRPDGLQLLRYVFGTRLDVGGTDEDGRVEVVIRGPSEVILAGELAGLVEWIDVIGPVDITERLADIGRSLVERYG